MLKSYSSTQRVKIIVFIFAVLLGVGILFLLLNIIENVKKEERSKILLWAGAIQKKIELVEYTNKLFEKLKEDERTKVEIWSGAMRQIMNEENSDNLTFLLKIISTNKNIPIIMTNTKGKIVSHVNLDTPPVPESYITDSLYADFAFYEPIAVTYNNEILNYLYYQDSKLFSELQLVMNNMVRNFISEVVLNSASVPVVITDSLHRQIVAYGNIDSTLLSDSIMLKSVLSKMESVNTPIRLHWFENETFYIFYEDSFLLNMLKYYPAAFMLIVILFLIIVYMAFRASRKYEQNQLWVGMSKETAHQLGTPISSIMAWLELLKLKEIDLQVYNELEKDVDRLQIIANRFSKIGSLPVKDLHSVFEIVNNSVNYIKTRSSSNYQFLLEKPDIDIIAPINNSLFEWVIENICKNAIDAIGHKGSISIKISDNQRNVIVDISDTGKGIPRSRFKTVFRPGFTTKKRGWGLGLSLVKRIIEEYHQGKVFVLHSEINIGTTFRIILPKYEKTKK